MARLINTETGVVVNVADDKVARMGPLYRPADEEKPAAKKAAPAAKSTSSK